MESLSKKIDLISEQMSKLTTDAGKETIDKIDMLGMVECKFVLAKGTAKIMLPLSDELMCNPQYSKILTDEMLVEFHKGTNLYDFSSNSSITADMIAFLAKALCKYSKSLKGEKIGYTFEEKTDLQCLIDARLIKEEILNVLPFVKEIYEKSKILVLFGINKSLVYIAENKWPSADQNLTINTFRGTYFIYFRPGAEQLLKFLFHHPRISVGILSSRAILTIKEILREFMKNPELADCKFRILLGRSSNKTFGSNRYNERSKGKLAADLEGSGFDLHNTLVVDEDIQKTKDIKDITFYIRPFELSQIESKDESAQYMKSLTASFKSALESSKTVEDIISHPSMKECARKFDKYDNEDYPKKRYRGRGHYRNHEDYE